MSFQLEKILEKKYTIYLYCTSIQLAVVKYDSFLNKKSLQSQSTISLTEILTIYFFFLMDEIGALP